MKFLPFQKADLARSALHDGHIKSWDTGGGKTVAAFTYPLLKCGYTVVGTGSTPVPDSRPPLEPICRIDGPRLVPDAPVLLVAPGDLHQQFAEEAAGRSNPKVNFHLELFRLDSQETFLRLTKGPDGVMRATEDGRPLLPNGFYLTSYTQLGSNGREPLPDPEKTDPRQLIAQWSIPIRAVGTGSTPVPDLPENARGAGGTRPYPNPVGTGSTPVPDPPYNGRDDDIPLPASIEGFWQCRESVWPTEHQRLGVTDGDLLADLDRNYQRQFAQLRRELATCTNLEQSKYVQNQIDSLTRDYELLAHLCPIRRPRVGTGSTPVPDVRDAGGTRPYPAAAETFWDCLTLDQQTWVMREYLTRWIAEIAPTVGTTRSYEKLADGRWIPASEDADTAPPLPAGEGRGEGEGPVATRTIRCVYQPTLSDLCYRAFDCVVADEGVRVKGEETLIAIGVRQMEAAYRCLLTATPVKNRLPDIFRLAWWVTGGKAKAHARFPFDGTAADRANFAAQFMVSEVNLSKIKAAKAAGNGNQRSRYTKLTPEVCQVHRLWKLFAPIILRRRKADFGVDIVPRVRHALRVPMGRDQQRVYAYHLNAPYLDKCGRPTRTAMGARLQALRVAAADPTSKLLKNFGPIQLKCQCVQVRGGALDPHPIATPDPDCPHCQGTGAIDLIHRSETPWTPKLGSVLQLVEEIVGRGEQVLIGAAFHDPLDQLGKLLTQAGVRNVVLDGRSSPGQRGAKVARFKAGRGAAGAEPVALAGVESMSDGHNLFRCNNVILLAYSWAFDKFKQFLDRVHRLNSQKPVNVYVVLADGTIDAKLESQVDDKSAAQELVLDGRLLGDRPDELNLADLLQVAQDEFTNALSSKRPAVCEDALEREWPARERRLRAAQQAWDAQGPHEAAECQKVATPVLPTHSTITPPPQHSITPPLPPSITITVTSTPMPKPTPVPVRRFDPAQPPVATPAACIPTATAAPPVPNPQSAIRNPHSARLARLRALANAMRALPDTQ